LGPAISRVEEDFAKKYGWTITRIWERNPAYQARQAKFQQIKPPQLRLKGSGQTIGL
jgi:hypothetical protein